MTNTQNDPKLKELQSHVDEVQGLMQDNLIKIRDREGRLSVLKKKADNLEEAAGGFQKITRKAKRKMWLRRRRMQIYIIVGVSTSAIVLLILVFVLLYLGGVFTGVGDSGHNRAQQVFATNNNSSIVATS